MLQQGTYFTFLKELKSVSQLRESHCILKWLLTGKWVTGPVSSSQCFQRPLTPMPPITFQPSIFSVLKTKNKFKSRLRLLQMDWQLRSWIKQLASTKGNLWATDKRHKNWFKLITKAKSRSRSKSSRSHKWNSNSQKTVMILRRMHQSNRNNSLRKKKISFKWNCVLSMQRS